MDEELETPHEGYKAYYKDKFKEVAEEYFASLVEESKVDKEANKETVKAYLKKVDEVNNLKKKFNNNKSLNTFLTVTMIAGIIIGLILTNLLISDGFSVIKLIVMIICYVAAIVAIFVKFLYLKKRIKLLKEQLEILEKEANEILNVAKRQMAPLNALFDWNIPVILTRKAIPTMELDQFFDAKKYAYLKEKYGLDNSNEKQSSVYVQSGSILGNPFLICKDYVNYIYNKEYSNSITIHWTTTIHTKDGTRRVSHSQTLTATVRAKAPGYYYSTYLVYGSEAAPNLTFSRMPTNVENMNDKQIEKFVKKRTKELNKKETKALTDKDKNTNYSRFGNDEFETIFGGTDRNNDVEYNLLFTPLAQSNMLKLLKDKEKIGYGDDFAFVKEKCINIIQSEHSQRTDYRANPTIFMGYDLEAMYKKFIDFNTNWFKSFYFDLAPLLSIPLYQSYKSKEYIYKGIDYPNLSTYEYEVMANQFDPDLLRPKEACTPSIYKTSFLNKKGNTDEFKITSHAYRGEKRVTIVSKMGGDGKIHRIPVHWIEYFPVSREINMIVNKNNQSRFEFNNSDHSKFNNLKSHFERGLIAFLGYQALFDADSAISTAKASNELNVEQLVQQLEAELDKQDLKQNTELNVKDEDLKGEEKEVQEEDIETSDEDDDDSKEQKDESKDEVIEQEDND